MFAVLLPVGPSDRDLQRLADGVDALRAAEPPDAIELILIDDAPEPRDLAARAGWRSACVIRTPLWAGGETPDPASAMVAGTLAGLRLAARLELDFVLKLDTDALAIAPFADAIAAAFADPAVGIVGSYDRTCTGGVRDWTRWERPLARVGLPLALVDARAGGSAAGSSSARLAPARPPAGCYGRPARTATSPARTASVAPTPSRRRCSLDRSCSTPPRGSPPASPRTSCVGLLCHAAGLELRGLVGPGEPFGLAHVGLPAPPAELIAAGHSIVHAVKHPDPAVEEDLRAAFRVARAS